MYFFFVAKVTIKNKTLLKLNMYEEYRSHTVFELCIDVYTRMIMLNHLTNWILHKNVWMNNKL